MLKDVGERELTKEELRDENVVLIPVIKDDVKLLEQTKNFEEYISLITSSHLSYCNCRHKQVIVSSNELFDEAYEKLDDYKKDNTVTVEKLRIKCRAIARSLVGEFNHDKGERCPIERKLVSELLGVLPDRYDETDTRVKLIIGNMIDMKLSSYRAAKYSVEHGFVKVRFDKYGNKIEYISPVEELKIKFSKTLIETLEKLENMLYGQKFVNLHVNIDNAPIPIAELYKRPEMISSDKTDE